MKKSISIILFCIVVFPVVLLGQGAKMQALFIYNFAKQIEWPSSDINNNFIIGIMGSEKNYADINNLLKGKKSELRDIQLVYFNSVKEISYCHILFIPNENSDLFYDVYSKVKSQPVLLVTNRPGMIEKGACVNFSVNEGKQAYEISKKNIESHNLQVSKQLVSLGISK